MALIARGRMSIECISSGGGIVLKRLSVEEGAVEIVNDKVVLTEKVKAEEEGEEDKIRVRIFTGITEIKIEYCPTTSTRKDL